MPSLLPKDAVTIAARYIGDRRDDGVVGARTVAYPRDRELKVDTRFDKSSYMPGDEASVALRIRTAEGLPQSSLVGLVVVDKAVEERARTDSDFGGASWFCDWCYRRLGRNDSLSGLSRRDLNRLDLNQPVSPDLELAAEILLNGSANRWPNDRLTDDSEGYPQRVFRELIANALKPIKAALDPRLAEEAKHPINDRSLKELLSSSGVDLDGFRDPWDNPYRFSFSVERGFDVLEIESAGPDKQFGSPDDFTAQRLTWQYFRQRGGALDDAVRAYHQRTRNFIRDFSTLKAELANAGENIDSWMDRWGRPYRFEFEVFRKQLPSLPGAADPTAYLSRPALSHPMIFPFGPPE
jgi:hypothetical protein